LQGANLQIAKLQGADLTAANLTSANLWNARLQGANLVNAKLQGAILFGVNLTGANLIRANLEGAKLLRPNLEGSAAKFDEKTVLPDGSGLTVDTVIERFTDPEHPDFWSPKVRVFLVKLTDIYEVCRKLECFYKELFHRDERLSFMTK
jgi:pentapeptide repeat protein